jgi:hypothetical protein
MHQSAAVLAAMQDGRHTNSIRHTLNHCVNMQAPPSMSSSRQGGCWWDASEGLLSALCVRTVACC